MQKNVVALITLIRNRLNNDSSSYEEKMLFMHNKGVTLSTSDTNLFFLKSDPRGHTSEISDLCNSIIFRGAELICYHGPVIPVISFANTQTGNFIWNQNTVFIQVLHGHKVYLFWDNKTNDWMCSDDKKARSPLKDLILSKIYNNLSLDVRYTYELILVETGEDPGLYLCGMYDNKKCMELEYTKVDTVALRHTFKRPAIYKFEGLEKLEKSDLPIIAQDQTTSKVRINEIQ